MMSAASNRQPSFRFLNRQRCKPLPSSLSIGEWNPNTLLEGSEDIAFFSTALGGDTGLCQPLSASRRARASLYRSFGSVAYTDEHGFQRRINIDIEFTRRRRRRFKDLGVGPSEIGIDVEGKLIRQHEIQSHPDSPDIRCAGISLVPAERFWWLERQRAGRCSKQSQWIHRLGKTEIPDSGAQPIGFNRQGYSEA